MEEITPKIIDFVPFESVTTFVVVRKKDVKEFNDRKFLSMEFGDSSGRIAAVWWEPDRSAVEDLQPGDIIKVKGEVQEYRGKPQLKVLKMRRAKEEEYDLADLLAASRFTQEELKSRVRAMSERIEDGYIRQLADSFWNDEKFLNEYTRAAAGKLWHHAYIGGLAEHSLNVTEICLDMVRRYDFLNRDHMIFGGLFHDMGKMSQYKITAFIDYSDEGRLVGHINWADHLIAKRAEQIENFPEKTLMLLRHLILSHHGELEFGAPIVPQTPEAFVLHYADEIDSKMGAVVRIMDKTGSGWSDYVNLIGRHLYFDKDNLPEKE